MKIKRGDVVEALDEAISGVVIHIHDDLVTIEDQSGFEFQYPLKALVLKQSGSEIEAALGNSDIEHIKAEKELKKSKSKEKHRPKAQLKAKFIVDLHIHHLTDSTKGMSNFDMLNLQLDTARKQLEFAIRERIPKMVIIHGVGEGVLRQELETLLRRYNNVQFYDADYKTYGLGATEIRIFQNIKP